VAQPALVPVADMIVFLVSDAAARVSGPILLTYGA